jgi:hypothetical protein
MRLNGWQRLWVVVTVVWTIGVVVVTWDVWPADPDWFTANSPLVLEVTAPNGTILEVETPDGELPSAATLEMIFRKSGNGSLTLAQRVRAKYPGVYDDLTDQQIEANVKAQYPGVYDDVPSTAPAALSVVKSEPLAGATRQPIAHPATKALDLTPTVRVKTPVATLEFPPGTDAATVQRAYDKQLNDDARAKRLAVVRQASAWWLLPPVVVYLLGWAIAWVYRGFRPARG